jgi:hypothetical protein
MDVSVTDTTYIPVGGDTHFPVLGIDATAGTIDDSGGGVHEWVAFPACGRWWVLTANTSQGRPPAGDVRRVAEGLVAGDPNHPQPTGVTGTLTFYPHLDPGTPIPMHGPIPGVGPTAGWAKAIANGVEAARVEVPASGRFQLDLPPGEYDIVATFGAKDELCGQQHVTVVEGHLRSLTFSCRR